MSGLDFQAELVTANNSIPIVLMTGHGGVPMSVKAMKLGAVDFLLKPVAALVKMAERADLKPAQLT